jgi:spore coat polysaccharide biosynthesis predicted glycosyltransferase SpsG
MPTRLSSDRVMANSNRGIVFRVDGGRAMGMGHVVRCQWLAKALREKYGSSVSFCMNGDDVGVAAVKRRGWPVVHVAPGELGGTGADALIIDLPARVSAEAVRAFRRGNPRTVVVLIDTDCSARIEADLVVNPLETVTTDSSRQGFRGKLYVGPAYAMVDPAFGRVPRRKSIAVRHPRLLVSMGGSDPYGLTLQALQALDGMQEEFHVTIAIGPAFLHEARLQAWLAGARRQYECRREDSLLDLMVNSDLALVSFGTTVYELAATGLPAVALSITDEHARSAKVFARGGSLIHLGLFSTVSAAEIQTAVRELLNSPHLRLTMAQRGQALVDGNGAEKVADLLVAKIHESDRELTTDAAQPTGPEL